MAIAVIYLLGAIHGLILALVLAQKEVNILPNRLLALIMVVISLDLGMAAFQSFELLIHYPQFIGIDYPTTLLYGPTLYLYVKTLRDGQIRMRKTDYLHFIPFVLLLLYLIPFYTESATNKLDLLSNIGQSHTHYAYNFGVINHVKILYTLFYVGCTLYMLVLYQRKLKDSFSSIEEINLNWLKQFMIGVVLVTGVSGCIYFFTSIGDIASMGLTNSIYDDITLLSSTAFVYGIGYMGLHQPEVFTQVNNGDGPNRSFVPTLNPDRDAKKKDTDSYQKSGLGRKEAEGYTNQLTLLMEEEKLYQISDLKLIHPAQKLDISPHNLTEIINHYMGQNFYDFVNGYRVEEVKRSLTSTKAEKQTLLAIGLDAGFNSKSTFNAVFKKQTGMTPSQFRKQSLAKSTASSKKS